MGRTEKAVFEVVIQGTIEEVWREITKTDELQGAMFNSRLETDGLRPGGQVRMRTKSGKYTSVVGEVLEFDPPRRYAHTFRFTNYDDAPCRVIYDLREEGPGRVRFTLTVLDMPAGTKTAKQMKQGGTMIVNTLKAIVETGRPSLGTRVLYMLFKVLEPLSPARTKSENWPV
jgi:uncharacterized protein YndB with AHSA1/START domain